MDEGSDVYSDTSAVIGPYGICCLCSQIKIEDALNLIQPQCRKIIKLFTIIKNRSTFSKHKLLYLKHLRRSHLQ
jgi:hypothetical protein